MSDDQNPTFPWQNRGGPSAPSDPTSEAAPPASSETGPPLPPYARDHAQPPAAVTPGAVTPDAEPPAPPAAPADTGPSLPPYASAADSAHATPDHAEPSAPPAAPADTGPALPPYTTAGYGAGATPPYAGPPAAYAIGAPPEPSNGLAVAALVMAIVGIVLGIIPFASFLGVPLALTAIVLAIVSLAKRRSRRGMSIATLIVAGIGTIIGGIVTAFTLYLWAAIGGFGSTGVSPATGNEESSPAPQSEELSEYSSPFADDDQVAAFLEEVAVGETAWWQVSSGYSFVAVFVDNASDGLSYGSVRAEIDVLGHDGIAIESASSYVSLAPGTTAVLVSVPVEAEDIDSVEVEFGTGTLYAPVPAAEPLDAEAGEPAVASGTVSIPGTLENPGADDAVDVRVTVIGRDGDGKIVVGRTLTVARVPAGGSVDFEAEHVALADDLPDDVTYELYARPAL